MSGGAHAIMSLGRYRNPPGPAPYAFGAAYEGDYFFTDYFLGAVRRIRLSGSTWAAAPTVPGQPNSTDWATGFTSVCDAATGQDGALYYVKQTPASIRRVRAIQPPNAIAAYAGANQAGNAGTPLLQPL